MENHHHPPPLNATLPRGSSGTPKSPKTKEFFFGTLERITARQPSVKRDKREAKSLKKESFRVRDLDKTKSFENFRPDEFTFREDEERKYIDPKSLQEPEVKEVVSNLTKWVNQVLDDSSTRISVQNLETDLFDGLVLKVLVQKLSGQPVVMPAGEFVQSEERQRINLGAVLRRIEDIIRVPEEERGKKWDVDTIFEKNLLSVLHLLLAIADHFSGDGKVLIDLPNSLEVNVIKVKPTPEKIDKEFAQETLINRPLTKSRDGFDTLIDHAPEKLNYVKRSLVEFANSHLSKINHFVQDLESDFSDGVNLILLIGLLEGFFVPYYCYDRSPETSEARLRNTELAFEFLESSGVRPRDRPSDVARGDLKAVLRILYCLFVKDKGEQG